MRLTRIISGGQTGADRAALDAAIALGVEHGGWCPKGRWAEDGPLHARYMLIETPSAEVQQRTEWNVRDADATLIIASPPLTGGTKLTQDLLVRAGKPWFCADPRALSLNETTAAIMTWLGGVEGNVLNVAGPRASEHSGIYNRAYNIIYTVLSKILKA